MLYVYLIIVFLMSFISGKYLEEKRYSMALLGISVVLINLIKVFVHYFGVEVHINI